jgi:hypothetical protein
VIAFALGAVCAALLASPARAQFVQQGPKLVASNAELNVTNGTPALVADFRLNAETANSNPAASAFRRNADDQNLLSRGYGQLPVILKADDLGAHTVEVKQGDRIELRFPRGFQSAYQLVADGRHGDLPIGSSWDAASGIFYWQPAPGFLGLYSLVFTNGTDRINLRVSVVP